jgi:phenylalanyl-tRNA synthetase beta chain
MKILVSWLRDFVDVPGSPAEIAAALSLRGFAVEAIEPAGPGDAVLDLEVTANRPDCLSVGGVAREVAVAFGLRVRRPAVGSAPDTQAPDTPPGLRLAGLASVEQGDPEVVIEAPDLCPRYAGAIADVRVGPSPAWLQARLQAAGVRPTSNVVDVTNYVLLELGQPMHAFDHARLAGGRIRVRTAREGERVRTIDGRDRELASTMLVIADAERPVAVAGVMGGAESEVTGDTRTIVLESAYFAPASVRRTSRALGLKTEASIRFERGADPRLPVTAMERACALLEAIGAGTARGTVVDRYPTRRDPFVVPLRRARIERLLGVAVPDQDVRRILDGLGFALHESDEGWRVTVPTRRVDVTREADLVEEVARHHGLDRVPMGFPTLTAAPPPLDPRIARARHLRRVLTGAGFSEAVTFGFMAEAAAAAFAPAASLARITNPLSEAFTVLRPSLLPGLVESAGRNIRRGRRDVRLFEIGSRFSQDGGETDAVAFVWSGPGQAPHWSERSREADFFDASGIVSRLADAFDADVELEPGDVPFLVAGQAAVVRLRPRDGARPADAAIGVVGRLAPAAGAPLDLPEGAQVYAAELALEPLAAAARPAMKAAAPPRFPAVERDLALLVDETTTARAIRDAIAGLALPILASVHEFDRYAGKGVPEGRISLAVRLVFRAPDRTLTDAEVQAAVDGVLALLRDGHGAVLR